MNCEYCGATFKSTFDLVNHLSILHEQKQFQKCDRCLNVYSMDLLLQFHSKCHTDTDPLVACDACDGETNTISKPFQCGKCGKCFMIADDLEKHIEIHAKNAIGTFECFICKMELKSLYATRIHFQLHKRAEKCTVCNENFTTTELEGHMCGGLRAMKCIYCKKSFMVMKELLRHLKEDCDNEKFFHKCDVCAKYYPMKILKDIHTKHGHSIEQISRPHLCDACPKRFATKNALHTHKKRHLLTRGNC